MFENVKQLFFILVQKVTNVKAFLLLCPFFFPPLQNPNPGSSQFRSRKTYNETFYVNQGYFTRLS